MWRNVLQEWAGVEGGGFKVGMLYYAVSLHPTGRNFCQCLNAVFVRSPTVDLKPEIL